MWGEGERFEAGGGRVRDARMFVVFVLPFGVLGVLVVLRWVRPATRLCAVALSIIVGLSGMLIATNLFGLVFRSFDAALVGAWIAGSACAVAFAIWQWRDPARGRLKGGTGKSLRGILAVLLPLTVLVGVLAFHSYFHDELPINGHLSTAYSIARGVYPPVLLSFPEVPFRYHYGFDVLAATAIRSGGLYAPDTIDGLSVVLFVCLFLTAWATVQEMTGSEVGAWIVALFCTLGGGFAGFLSPFGGFEGGAYAGLIQESAGYRGVAVNPTMLSYFFQHPFALGMPLFLAIMYLYVRFTRERRPGLIFVAAGLLGALALAQIALFAILCCGILAYPVIASVTRTGRFRAIAPFTGVCVAAGLGLAWLNGGFFARSDAFERGLVHLRAQMGAVPGGVIANLVWSVASNGWTLVLLPAAALVAIWKRRDLGLFASALSFGAVLVPHLFVYERSWDIIKFLTVSYVAGSVALGDLAGFLSDRCKGRWMQAAAGLVILTGVTPGVSWLGGKLQLLATEGLPAFAGRSLEGLDYEAIDWLNKHTGRDDVLVTEEDLSRDLAACTGMFTPFPDVYAYQDLSLRRCQDREDELFMAVRDLCFRRLYELGADWLYLTEAGYGPANPRSRRDVAYFMEKGWVALRTFGDPGAKRRRYLYRLAFPSGDFECLCNLDRDAYLRSQGAVAEGEDLLTRTGGSIRERWRGPDGGRLSEAAYAGDGDRASCLRVRRGGDDTGEKDIVAVARIPAEVAVGYRGFEITFEGRADYPSFGDVKVRLVREGESDRAVRWYRWTAREWTSFSFFAELPRGATGDLEVVLQVTDGRGPGEVLYDQVKVRGAQVPEWKTLAYPRAPGAQDRRAGEQVKAEKGVER